MTIKTSRIDLKTLAASAAVVGALAFAPAVHAQTTGAQPAGPGHQDRVGQTGQMGQTGQTGQMGQTGQTGQMGQPGQTGQMGQTGQTGQMGQQPGAAGQPQVGQEQQQPYGQQLGTAEREQLDRQLMNERQQVGQQQDSMGQPGQRQAGAEGKGTQLYVSSDSIRHVQEALKEHDHDIEVDGQWGPETSAALREFQQKQDLEATGQLNIATLQALGVAEQLGFQESDVGQEQQRQDHNRQQQRDQDQDQDQQQRQQQ